MAADLSLTKSKEEKLKVLHIQWFNIPRAERIDLLLNMTMKGSYIANLPYAIPDNVHTWRIPVPLKDNIRRSLPLYSLFTLRTIDFERVRTSDNGHVWRRINN